MNHEPASLIARLGQEYPEIWQCLNEISLKFRAHGHGLFLVGGAVRNLVLSLGLKDFDLASDARPEDILKMFRTVIPTGIQHGTVTLVYRKHHFEITTFRLDGEYSDARRPDSVVFTPDIHEDLKRRDFTINAMALDLHSHELLDPHHGRQDLVRKLMRTVGPALDRFDEDGLRIMRGLRFAAQLGFPVETKTWEAMSQRLNRLSKVSVERFRDEIQKTLEAPLPSRGLYLMQELGALGLFLPDLAALDQADFGLSCLMADLCARRPELRLAALLHRLPPEQARASLLSLRCSGAELKQAMHLIGLLEQPYRSDWTEADLRRFAARAGRDFLEPAVTWLNLSHLARQWLQYNPAEPPRLVPVPVLAPDSQAGIDQAIDCCPAWAGHVEDLRALPDPFCLQFKDRMLQAMHGEPALTIGELAVKGGDLQAAGIPAGPLMGRILAALLAWVLEDPQRNQAALLLLKARELYAEPKSLS